MTRADRREAFRSTPPGLVTAFAAAKVNIGLRHILPVYPFLLVLASRVATVRFSRRWLAPVIIGTPLVFTAVSTLRIAPHQLAYFNEAVGGPSLPHPRDQRPHPLRLHASAKQNRQQ